MNKEQLLKNFDLKHVLLGSFLSFGNRLQKAVDRFYPEVSCKQFFLLMGLSVFKESPPTLNELSDLLGSSHQNIKQIAIKLEKNGFIKICQDTEDRRKLRVEQTEKLRNMGEQYQVKEKEFMDLFYQGISDEELEITARVIGRLEENVKYVKGWDD